MKSTSSAGTTSASTQVAAGAGQLKTTLACADDAVTQGVLNLQLVHQARLAQAKRTLAVLTAQYGATDPRVAAAQAGVAAINTTIGRVAMIGQQLAAPAVQVATNGWALQGRVVDAQLNAAVGFTVFLVDAEKTFVQSYGFAYTNANGYFVLSFAGATDEESTGTGSLFIEVADTSANPIYLSDTPFQPVLGTASFQNIVLATGTQPIGDPPAAIRAVAIPATGATTGTGAAGTGAATGTGTTRAPGTGSGGAGPKRRGTRKS
jgi:hypothetical protein